MKPWEQSFRGYTWQDMPGSDQDVKKMNFYLFRIGRLDVHEASLEAGEDEIVEDDQPRSKRRRVVSLEQTRFGSQGRKAVRSEAIRCAHEAELRTKDAVKTALGERRAKVKAILRPVMEQWGGLRQVAQVAKVTESSVGLFLKEDYGIWTPSVLERLEAVAARMQAGEWQVTRRVSRTGVRRDRVPAGFMSLKQWLEREAERRRVKVHQIRMRIHRGHESLPVGTIRRNARCVYVPVESGVAA